MDFDALLKQLQNWTNRVPLIILGSGASIPYGLPSMNALGEHLKSNLSFLEPEDKDQLKEFIAMFDKLKDLEQTLYQLNLRDNVYNEIVNQTWNFVNAEDLKAYAVLINNINEFPLADLLKHLIKTAEKKVSIVTTNYDRLAEYAASLSEAFICTGYALNYIGHFSKAIHTNNITNLKGFSGEINIWKVHGSLDWYKTSDDRSVQLPLQHQMPKGYKPSIVTPGTNKYLETHIEPYRTILSQADTEIENANGYFCIGYGFNDIHMQPKLIAEIKKEKPIIVITKNLTENTKKNIVDNKCKHYILIEEESVNNTKIYSSMFDDYVVLGQDYWKLNEYLKLIKS